jgi:hypothetical protein
MTADPARALTNLADAAYEAASALPRGSDALDGEDARAGANRPSRDPASYRSIGFWTTLAAHKALHHLRVDEETTTELLMNEALNLLFATRCLPQLAPTARAAAAIHSDLESGRVSDEPSPGRAETLDPSDGG